jgi:hypothetical protein
MLVDKAQAVAFSGRQPIQPVNTLVHPKPSRPCIDLMPIDESNNDISTVRQVRR